MSRQIATEPLSSQAFAPFGQVIDCAGEADKMINQGQCRRYHDRVALDFLDGRAGVSLFQSDLRTLPYDLTMMERHPDGSQCFLPMDGHGFLVIVAPDAGGAPGRPKAFLTAPGQGVNYGRGVWHGVLTPLAGSGQFAVIDRIGPGANLEEHWFDEAWTVTDGRRS